jgi:hypothetical protein
MLLVPPKAANIVLSPPTWGFGSFKVTSSL